MLKKSCLILQVISSLGLEKTRGGIPLYKPHRHLPPQRFFFLRCFALKTGIDFAGPFWSGIRVRYHTLWGSTYLYGLYEGNPPPPPPAHTHTPLPGTIGR